MLYVNRGFLGYSWYFLVNLGDIFYIFGVLGVVFKWSLTALPGAGLSFPQQEGPSGTGGVGERSLRVKSAACLYTGAHMGVSQMILLTSAPQKHRER